MTDAEQATYLSDVIGVVEATSYEKLMLWSENRGRDNPKTWEEGRIGFGETVGHLDDMPVCISVLVDRVDGHKILFLEATSRVVDHRMIDVWLAEHLPPSAFRDDEHEHVNRTDSMNFHNIFPR